MELVGRSSHNNNRGARTQTRRIGTDKEYHTTTLDDDLGLCEECCDCAPCCDPTLQEGEEDVSPGPEYEPPINCVGSGVILLAAGGTIIMLGSIVGFIWIVLFPPSGFDNKNTISLLGILFFFILLLGCCLFCSAFTPELYEEGYNYDSPYSHQQQQYTSNRQPFVNLNAEKRKRLREAHISQFKEVTEHLTVEEKKQLTDGFQRLLAQENRKRNHQTAVRRTTTGDKKKISYETFIDGFLGETAPSMTEKLAATLLRGVDCEVDGLVDMDEFMTAVAIGRHGSAEERLLFVYNCVDSSRDSTYSRRYHSTRKTAENLIELISYACANANAQDLGDEPMKNIAPSSIQDLASMVNITEGSEMFATSWPEESDIMQAAVQAGGMESSEDKDIQTVLIWKRALLAATSALDPFEPMPSNNQRLMAESAPINSNGQSSSATVLPLLRTMSSLGLPTQFNYSSSNLDGPKSPESIINSLYIAMRRASKNNAIDTTAFVEQVSVAFPRLDPLSEKVSHDPRNAIGETNGAHFITVASIAPLSNVAEGGIDGTSTNARPKEMARKLFHAIDLNGDGVLQEAEFKLALKTCFFDETDDDVAAAAVLKEAIYAEAAGMRAGMVRDAFERLCYVTCSIDVPSSPAAEKRILCHHAHVDSILTRMGGSRHIHLTNPQPGDAWCVLPTEWLHRWCTFVGIKIPDDHLVTAKTNSQSIEDKKGYADALVLSRRPPPLDTRVLLAAPDYKELRQDIYEHDTYEVLPLFAWQAIHAWYSAGSEVDELHTATGKRDEATATSLPILRFIVKRPSGELELELYPTFSSVVLADSMSGELPSDLTSSNCGTVALSTSDSLLSVKAKACLLFGLALRDTRLWIADSEEKGHSSSGSLLKGVFTSMDSRSRNLQWILGEEQLDSTVEEVNLCRMELLLEPRNPRTGRFTRKGVIDKQPKSKQSGEKTKTEMETDGRSGRGSGVPTGEVGLQNLGNTCFMNAALQCLAHCPPLRYYFALGEYEFDINQTSKYGMGGKVALAFGELVHDMVNNKKASVVSSFLNTGTYANAIPPRPFKRIIGRYDNRYRGYMQQDASEFLAKLLEGLSEDLNGIEGDKPYIPDPDEDGRTDWDLANEHWQRNLQRENHPITAIMTGQLLSEMNSKETKERKVTFEPFSSLQLPLPEARDHFITVRIIFACHRIWPLDAIIRIPYGGTIDDLLKEISGLDISSDAIEDSPEFARGKVTAPLKYEDLVASYDISSTGLPMIISKESGAQNYENRHINVFEMPSEEPAAGDVKELAVSQLVEASINTRFRNKYGETTIQMQPYKAEIVISPYESDVGMSAMVRLLSGTTSGRNIEVPVSNIKILEPIKVRVVLRTLQKVKESSDSYFIDPMRPTTFGRSFFVSVKPGSTTGYDLYKLVWQQIRPFHTNLPGESAVDTGGIDSPNFKFPFSLQNTLNEASRLGERPIVSDMRNPRLAGDSMIKPEDEADKLKLISDNTILLVDVPIAARKIWNDRLLDFSLTHKNIKEMRAIMDRPDKLEHCLERLISPERVTAHSRVKTREQGEYAETEFLKTNRIWSAPAVLSFVLKRFCYVERTGRRYKLNSTIQFPLENFDLSAYMVPLGEDEELNSGGDAAGRKKPSYKLTAVINHHGSLNGGHYTAYVRAGEDPNTWLSCNDSTVRVADPAEIVSRAAYCLFYSRSDVPWKGKDVSNFLRKRFPRVHKERVDLDVIRSSQWIAPRNQIQNQTSGGISSFKNHMRETITDNSYKYPGIASSIICVPCCYYYAIPEKYPECCNNRTNSTPECCRRYCCEDCFCRCWYPWPNYNGIYTNVSNLGLLFWSCLQMVVWYMWVLTWNLGFCGICNVLDLCCCTCCDIEARYCTPSTPTASEVYIFLLNCLAESNTTRASYQSNTRRARQRRRANF